MQRNTGLKMISSYQIIVIFKYDEVETYVQRPI